MDDLTAFLRARLGERERAAQAAKPGPWFDDGGSVCATHPTDQVVDYTESAEHIAENDPTFALAEVDAKRQTLDEHAESETGECSTCVVGEWGYPTASSMSKPASFPCRTVRLLAVPYAGHPDYREEWRP